MAHGATEDPVIAETQDHWLPGFNSDVEEWDAKGLTYETQAIIDWAWTIP